MAAHGAVEAVSVGDFQEVDLAAAAAEAGKTINNCSTGTIFYEETRKN